MPNKIHYLWVRPYKTYVSDRQFLTDVNNFEHEKKKSTVVNGSADDEVLTCRQVE